MSEEEALRSQLARLKAELEAAGRGVPSMPAPPGGDAAPAAADPSGGGNKRRR